MVSVLWKACVGEEAQDIAEYAVMLAVILVIVVGTIRLVGSNANNGREFGAISDRSCRHDKLAPTVVDFAWSVSEFSRALGHEFCDGSGACYDVLQWLWLPERSVSPEVSGLAERCCGARSLGCCPRALPENIAGCGREAWQA